MKITDRWTLNQRSPKPGNKLDILTEADIKQSINNKKNIEGGNKLTNDQMKQFAQMNNFFAAMKNQNPFMMNKNPFMAMKTQNPFMSMNNGMFVPQG